MKSQSYRAGNKATQREIKIRMLHMKIFFAHLGSMECEGWKK